MALHTVIKQYFDIDFHGMKPDLGMTADSLTMLMEAGPKVNWTSKKWIERYA